MNEEHHNIWTLSKHLAGSVNHAAGNLDKAIYSPQPVHTVVSYPQPTWYELHPIFGILSGIGLTILIVAIFIAYIMTDTKNDSKTSSSWWWFIF